MSAAQQWFLQRGMAQVADNFSKGVANDLQALTKGVDALVGMMQSVLGQVAHRAGIDVSSVQAKSLEQGGSTLLRANH